MPRGIGSGELVEVRDDEPFVVIHQRVRLMSAGFRGGAQIRQLVQLADLAGFHELGCILRVVEVRHTGNIRRAIQPGDVRERHLVAGLAVP